ncbi:hypothetical protein [Leptolyngbya sp. FACHB-671]|nr:hypothetical protein [Leptolyngbya sp. FACHB-671]
MFRVADLYEAIAHLPTNLMLSLTAQIPILDRRATRRLEAIT